MSGAWGEEVNKQKKAYTDQSNFNNGTAKQDADICKESPPKRIACRARESEPEQRGHQGNRGGKSQVQASLWAAGSSVFHHRTLV